LTCALQLHPGCLRFLEAASQPCLSIPPWQWQQNPVCSCPTYCGTSPTVSLSDTNTSRQHPSPALSVPSTSTSQVEAPRHRSESLTQRPPSKSMGFHVPWPSLPLFISTSAHAHPCNEFAYHKLFKLHKARVPLHTSPAHTHTCTVRTHITTPIHRCTQVTFVQHAPTTHCTCTTQAPCMHAQTHHRRA
jgi:hypothetical protein